MTNRLLRALPTIDDLRERRPDLKIRCFKGNSYGIPFYNRGGIKVRLFEHLDITNADFIEELLVYGLHAGEKQDLLSYIEGNQEVIPVSELILDI